MESFNLAGVAMIQSQQGGLIIAQALWTTLTHTASRATVALARLMAKVPGPQLLATDLSDETSLRR